MLAQSFDSHDHCHVGRNQPHKVIGGPWGRIVRAGERMTTQEQNPKTCPRGTRGLETGAGTRNGGS